MTFTLKCMAGELARALNLASHVAGREKMMPILKAARLVVADGTASISATNMDHVILIDVAADGDGEAFVDIGLIAPKISTLSPNSPVSVKADADGKFITVSQSKTKWRIPLLLGDGFPSKFVGRIDGEARNIPAGALFAAMAAATQAIKPGDGPAQDKGAWFDMQDGFRVVGTTGKVMAVVQLGAPSLPVSFLMPNSALATLPNLFRGVAEISVIATENAVSFEADDVVYKTKLVEAPYPDWRRAVLRARESMDGLATVSSEELVTAVKRASMVEEDKVFGGGSLGVRIAMASNELTATSRNRQFEEGTDVCAINGDDGTFAVSAAYLVQLASSFSSEALAVRYSKTEADKGIEISTSPASELENYRIIMPMLVA